MKVWEVVKVIEESPVKCVSSDGLDVVFQTPEGYRYEVFFDCGEPDYLHWFDEPDGTRIEFWAKSDGVDENRERARSAMAYIAGNLLHLPHVGDRLKIAEGRLLVTNPETVQ